MDMRLRLCAFLLCWAVFSAAAQDENAGSEAPGFGFDSAQSGTGKPFSLKTGGKIAGRLLAYNRVISGAEDFELGKLGDLFGSLDTAFNSPYIDAFLNVRFDTDRLLFVDEAYVRFAVNAFEADLGLRKIVWGRADSMGPLDVVNPLDYSDLTDITNQLGMKLPRPLFRLAYRIGDFSAIEGVFVPVFRAAKFDRDGRWKPLEFESMEPLLALSGLSYTDKKESLEYAQGGVRFSAVTGPVDFGAQYYTGIFSRPAVSVNLTMPFPFVLVPMVNSFAYNRFHQTGVDAAFVLAGFNIRTEAGVLLTNDLSGDDPAVENPAVFYSAGFDRDLVWGIKLNLQANGKVRLLQDKLAVPGGLGLGVYDAETKAGEGGLPDKKPLTSTTLTGILTKKFLRDELELKVTGLWNIEGRDFLVVPAVIWTKNDISLELSAGFFGGDDEGEFGQYWKNSYVKTVLAYTF